MVTVWNETSLEVSWYVEGNVSLYISSENEQNISNAFFEGNGTHLFENLTAGTKYSISAYRVIGMVYSENATSVVTYTSEFIWRAQDLIPNDYQSNEWNYPKSFH